MNNISKFLMPKRIDDGRADGLLEIIHAIRSGSAVELSFEKTEIITPAGHAILFIILDLACEHKILFKISNYHKNLALHLKIIEASNLGKPLSHFFNITDLSKRDTDLIVYGKTSSIAPEFIEMLEQRFEKTLGEDRLWDVTLIFNELMQNTVDHSTAERFFLYAGLGESGKNFEFGILDMGVSIPAKLETKYQCKNDEEYLEKVFEKGVGTRRNRPGGMGLYYLFENIKDLKGRLVILSRDAQVRKNFGTRNYNTSKLKRKLSGTWCLANIPLE